MSNTALPQQDGVYGTEQLTSDQSEFNRLMFMMQSVVGALNVATLVEVKAVTTGGRMAVTGFVDVVPLVNQITGQGSAIPHATVYQLPFIRIQGGSNAFICDPQVGDIGLAIFCDRDISAVKASAKAASPGSYRRFSYADGVYIGGWNRSVAPVNAVILDASGCEITCATKVDGNVNLNGGVLQVNGTQVVTSQQPAITPPTGGSTVDTQARTAINTLISTLRTHGLTA